MSRRKKPIAARTQQADAGSDSSSSRLVIQLGAVGLLLALLVYLLLPGFGDDDAAPSIAGGSDGAATEARQAAGEDLPAAPVTIEPAVIRFGEVLPNTTHTQDVLLTNNGNTPVRIVDARPSCPCTKVHRPANTINPGRSITMSIEMDSEARIGPKGVTVNVMFAGYGPMRIPVSATVVDGPA
jgi:hypothetical protein